MLMERGCSGEWYVVGRVLMERGCSGEGMWWEGC